jgi:hypothetical protein
MPLVHLLLSLIHHGESSNPSPAFYLPVQADKPIDRPHLENSFDAIRGTARLTCPAEVGYETTVFVRGPSHPKL